MRRSEFNSLPHGSYRVAWKTGGESLALVGSNSNGTRWLICTNWIDCNGMSGEDLKSVEQIEDIQHVTFLNQPPRVSRAPRGITHWVDEPTTGRSIPGGYQSIERIKTSKRPDYEELTMKVIPPVQGRTVWDWLVEDKDSKCVLINFSIVAIILLLILGMFVIQVLKHTGE